ncbi:MAG TPA: hypothetical protein PKN48_06200 [Bacteroidales bacterium]|nr:hypothetical protein [Bacteroidales bacterium]
MTVITNEKKIDHRKTAHLFPAFVPEYLGIETQVIESYGTGLPHYLEKASDITGSDLRDFDVINNNFLTDQLKSQYIAYIISCCVSDLLHSKKQYPAYVTSYSMGIYAALYHCGSIDFETGLNMIKTAFGAIEKNLQETPFSMGAIGGLSLDDVTSLILPFSSGVFIINQNSEFSFLLSGHRRHLEQILTNATDMGALQVRMLPVSHPYHSPLLKTAAAEFHEALWTMEIGNNTLHFVSPVNQKIILTKDEIIAELTHNIFHGFDWYQTFRFLLNNGVNTFVECGAGESLYRMGKFIEGDFEIYNLKKIHKIC